MRGMKVRWLIGPRSLITSTDRNGKPITRTGKNGGPVVDQLVVKQLLPKGTS
jgi:hypothetical protein